MNKRLIPYAGAIISTSVCRLNLKARYGNSVGCGMFNAGICTALNIAANDSSISDEEFEELQVLAGDSENREFWKRGLEHIL